MALKIPYGSPLSALLLRHNNSMETNAANLKEALIKKFFASTLLALSVAGSAGALSPEDPLEAGFGDFQLFETNPVEFEEIVTPILSDKATIAVARVDGGRLIETPYTETVDWNFLDRRTDHEIIQLGAANYIKYIPEIPFQGQDTDNKIDEIRLTAAAEGIEYVLIYGVGPDAGWAGFGKKALHETGLTVRDGCESWSEAKAKALLVNAYTGDVIGAVTADNIEYNIGQLADRVGDMISDLSAKQDQA